MFLCFIWVLDTAAGFEVGFFMTLLESSWKSYTLSIWQDQHC